MLRRVCTTLGLIKCHKKLPSTQKQVLFNHLGRMHSDRSPRYYGWTPSAVSEKTINQDPFDIDMDRDDQRRYAICSWWKRWRLTILYLSRDEKIGYYCCWCPCLKACLIGSLICGIVLATAIALWLTDASKNRSLVSTSMSNYLPSAKSENIRRFRKDEWKSSDPWGSQSWTLELVHIITVSLISLIQTNAKPD